MDSLHPKQERTNGVSWPFEINDDHYRGVCDVLGAQRGAQHVGKNSAATELVHIDFDLFLFFSLGFGLKIEGGRFFDVICGVALVQELGNQARFARLLLTTENECFAA